MIGRRFIEIEYAGEKLSVRVPTLKEWRGLKTDVGTEEGTVAFLVSALYQDGKPLWASQDEAEDNIVLSEIGPLVERVCEAIGVASQEKKH